MPPQETEQQRKPLLTIEYDEELEKTAYESDERVLIFGIDGESEGLDFDSGQAPLFSWKKLWLSMSLGFLMSIAFLDPGNLEGYLQASVIAKYSSLWLLLWATAMGFLVQLLAARLGCSSDLCFDFRGRGSRSP